MLSSDKNKVSSTPNNVDDDDDDDDDDDNSSGGIGDVADVTGTVSTTEQCRRRRRRRRRRRLSPSNDVATISPQQLTSIEEKFPSKMLLSYSREIICLVVGIVLSLGFAAFESVPPRISKVPAARPFFNQSSLILDFYKGHLDAMVERASDADLTFVMYYAPWDAESQAARHEFENVAQYYYSKIFFAAINCWHPGSECRQRYNKILSYPVFMLYSSRDSGILYRGILSAPYMIRFLESFLKPIVRITNREQLTQLVVENDAVVVGFVEFNGLSKSPGYREFYTAATRFLEKDPNRDVAFAIVTDPRKANDDFGMISFPSASLVMWNETLIYPREKLFTSENLLEWIGKRIHKVALWLQPPGVKSLTLAPYFRDGPVLFLFTPRNPLHRFNYHFNLLKQVALEYYNCNGILPMTRTTDRLRDKIDNAATVHRERTKLCSLIVNQSKIEVTTSSVIAEQWINDSCCANVLLNKCDSCKNAKIQSAICSLSSENHQEVCETSDVFKLRGITDNEEQQQHCCSRGEQTTFQPRFEEFRGSFDNTKKFKSSMLTGENDGRSAKAIRETFRADECKKLLVGNEYNYPIFPRISTKGRTRKSMISSCKKNKTLTLIAIDSLQYSHFADVLGIDILKRRDKTALVILDSDRESQYSIEGIPSEDTLIEFIDSYSMDLLKRTLRSETSEKVFSSSNSNKRIEENYGDSGSEEEIAVPELTTDTFTKVVMDPTMNVVVMYHTPYCAFCSAVGYVYLTVAKYFSRIEYLSFVRIDGDNNDLPWEYTMDRYPSILFFPAKRKEDSTVYPYSLPLTVRNLLNFVLANLDDDTHVEALVEVCHLGSGESPKDCVIRIRRLCLDIIENLLRSYRKLQRIDGLSITSSTQRRREILLKLNHIRDIHLILGSVDDLRKDHQKYLIVRQTFKTYHRNLVALDNPEKKNEEKL